MDQKKCTACAWADLTTALTLFVLGLLFYVIGGDTLPMLGAVIALNASGFALRGLIGFRHTRQRRHGQNVTNSTIHGDSVQISGHRH
jgi:archaellum biogenesis protein FlaJ (TadC family)